MRYKCPCCGFYTFEEPLDGSYNICPVCFWEDDAVQQREETCSGGANKVSLAQARKNYAAFGACEPDAVKWVREPGDNEKKAYTST